MNFILSLAFKVFFSLLCLLDFDLVSLPLKNQLISLPLHQIFHKSVSLNPIDVRVPQTHPLSFSLDPLDVEKVLSLLLHVTEKLLHLVIDLSLHLSSEVFVANADLFSAIINFPTCARLSILILPFCLFGLISELFREATAQTNSTPHL